MSKRILIFSIAYPPFVGGAELAIKETTDRLCNIEFDMITLRFNSRLPKQEKLGNVNVYRIGFSKASPTMADLVKWPLKLNKFLFPITACWKAGQLHKKNKYDATWAMMAAYAGFAAMFFKIIHPSVPYLLTLQEGDPIEYILGKVKLVRPFFKMIFTKANFIQAISNYLADWACTMGFKGEIEVVPNAVAVAHFSQKYSDQELTVLKQKLNKTPEDKFVITTSRLVKKNAADDVIKSLPYLPANVKFLILGTGPDETMLKNLTKELKVEDRVIFYGQVDHKDMPMFLKISDVFIRPSLSEGLGNSFLEAMAAEIPVIATPVGGIPDFLFDPSASQQSSGQANPEKPATGLFCNVRDPESIAEKINTFLTDEALRQKIVANARQLVVENYDWELIAEKMGRIFEKLTSHNS